MEYRELFHNTNRSLELAHCEFNSTADPTLLDALTYKIKYLEMLMDYYLNKLEEESREKETLCS